MSRLIIKGGTVYDPLTGRSEKRELKIVDNKIAAPGEDAGEETEIIDASGCMVVPGLIDYHIHLYTGCDGGVAADPITLPSGVTTAVDGGTCGASSFEMFARHDIAFSVTRLKAFLNVSSGGLATGKFPENVDPRYFEREKMKELFRRYPHQLTALKFRISKGIVGPTGLTREPLEKTIELAEEIGCPVVVHMNDPIISAEETAALLRPGDVFCHMYHGMGDTIIDETGHVKRGIKEARERGVLFDACNGKNNFTLQVAKAAVKEGFLPDIISTDISPMTCYRQPVISLPRVLSKYLNMGMTFQQVIDCATRNPAKQLKLERELGSLQAGTTADVAIFKVVEKPVTFCDYLGKTMDGGQVIVPQMTIKDGQIVYCQADFN